MTKKSILFLSNGFAEDTIGANLISELRLQNPQLNFFALPIVGNGAPYEQVGAKIIGPRWDLPSYGITYGPEFDVKKELKAGAIQLYLGKLLTLIWNRRKFDLVICVGDYLSTAIAGLVIKKPLMYLWVTVSHFDWVARHFLKKYSKIIFSRWRKWSDLKEYNVQFVGNPYMDTMEITGDNFGFDKSIPTIGILPGSRQPAFNNLPKIVEVMNLILKKRKVNFIFALSPTIEKNVFLEKAKYCSGWSDKFSVEYKFGDVLNVSDLVLGLAGTANEQAAGLGKPIVTFWGGGASREENLVKGHAARLLGESCVVLPGVAEKVADTILSLLADSAKMKQMGEAGKELNGGQEGNKIMAERINQWLMKN